MRAEILVYRCTVITLLEILCLCFVATRLHCYTPLSLQTYHREKRAIPVEIIFTEIFWNTWLLLVDPFNKTANTSEHCEMVGPALGMPPADGTSQNKSTTLIANEWSTTVSLMHILRIMFDINFMVQATKHSIILYSASIEPSKYYS